MKGGEKTRNSYSARRQWLARQTPMSLASFRRQRLFGCPQHALHTRYHSCMRGPKDRALAVTLQSPTRSKCSPSRITFLTALERTDELASLSLPPPTTGLPTLLPYVHVSLSCLYTTASRTPRILARNMTDLVTAIELHTLAFTTSAQIQAALRSTDVPFSSSE